jgi:predicted 3-demethylubiquinone-9 3-methyltransferase (glyoxalase superfamily)
MKTQKVTPFLWFDDKAEEAVKLYVSLFKNSKIGKITRYGEAGAKVSGRPKGSVMTVAFQLDGQEFAALNGGPHFKFTEAISLVVNCKTQEEIDELWEKLSEGGEQGQCGWLKDKYGLSWQIVPAVLSKMLNDKDAEKSNRVIHAIIQMRKLDIKRVSKRMRDSVAAKSTLTTILHRYVSNRPEHAIVNNGGGPCEERL